MVNSLSCPKMSNPTSQNCPDLSNSNSMSDINMSSVMGMGLMSGQSGLVLGAGSLSGLSMPDDCKPPEVKLEVLDELFGSGWADHGLSMAASPSSESSLSPSPPSSFDATSFSTSLLSTVAPHLSLKSTSSLLAVSSAPPASVMAAAAARTLKIPLPGEFLTNFSSNYSTTAPHSVVSAAMAAAENGSLQIIIPSTTPGPDTTSNGSTISFKSPTSVGASSAESSGSIKKTVFTAKGKTY